MQENIIKTKDQLTNIVRKTVIAAGADKRNADIVTEHLISSNLKGVDTHGLWCLPIYLNWIKSGELNPAAWPEIVKETNNSALIKGNWTFGQVTAKFAMDIAIDKAKKFDISTVSGVQVTHTGRVGAYAEMAAKEKIISFVFNGGFSAQRAVPYGGKRGVLDTNPMAIGFPAGEEPPMVADFATTAVSAVKIDLARLNKRNLAPGCIVDKDGNATCNPEDYFNGGAFLPFGGHKGYALMLANEFLGRIFTNSDSFNTGRNLCSKPLCEYIGFTIIAFKPDLYGSFKDYSTKIDDMERQVRKIPPAPGFTEVMIPGDMERKVEEERLKNGIPIPINIWDRLKDSAKDLGIDIGSI